MPRSLRSGSRQKKLQMQHIQQVNKTLRVSISKCIAANIDDFNQVEFLSLFGLTQIGMKNGQMAKRDGSHIKRTRSQYTNEHEGTTLKGTLSVGTAVSSNDFDEAFQHRYQLGKCHMLHAIFGRYSIVSVFFAIFENRM